jgi:hypothetical protein
MFVAEHRKGLFRSLSTSPLRTSELLTTNGQMKEPQVSTIYKSELLIMAKPPNLVTYLLPDKRFSTHT